jgi:diphthine synthase
VGTLYFVGLGLADERDLSERAFAELQACPTVLAELYTSAVAPGSLERLSQRLGRPVRLLDRGQVEEEKEVLSALADPARSPVGLLSPGDPVAAPTHIALRVSAERAGHDWVYRPNASILTAAGGFLGLMPYRFGRPVSLAFPDPHFLPMSPLALIKANRSAGAHTLVLLDLNPQEGRYLRAEEALAILHERDPEGQFVPPEADVAVVARLGSAEARGWVGPLSRLRQTEFGPPLHAVVVMAPTLHFEEEEASRRYRLPAEAPPAP